MLRKVILIAAAVLVLAGFSVLGVRFAQVHAETGEWRLSPSKAPPRVHLHGRDYERSGVAPTSTCREADPTVVGATPGGGYAFLPPCSTDTGAVPTVIDVYDGETTWAYELVGGP